MTGLLLGLFVSFFSFVVAVPQSGQEEVGISVAVGAAPSGLGQIMGPSTMAGTAITGR